MFKLEGKKHPSRVRHCRFTVPVQYSCCRFPPTPRENLCRYNEGENVVMKVVKENKKRNQKKKKKEKEKEQKTAFRYLLVFVSTKQCKSPLPRNSA